MMWLRIFIVSTKVENGFQVFAFPGSEVIALIKRAHETGKKEKENIE